MYKKVIISFLKERCYKLNIFGINLYNIIVTSNLGELNDMEVSFDNMLQFINYIFNLSLSENSYFFYLVIFACILSVVSLYLISKFAAAFIPGYSLAYHFRMAISMIGVSTIIYFVFGNLLMSCGVIPITQIKLTDFILLLFVCLIICFLLIRVSRNGYMNTLDVYIFLILFFSIFAALLYISASPYIVEDKLVFGNIEPISLNSYYSKVQTNPIDIRMTGPDTGLHVIMLSGDLKHSKEISSIFLCPKNFSEQANNSLVGYTKGSGFYHIDFNCMSLPTGNYTIILENAKYKSINYLLRFEN